ncbi:MAG TPA: hypothetical protein VHC86_01680 [Opitutaceae bacterium]|nr:hypothetical protein [Opitutaceae bacterium]
MHASSLERLEKSESPARQARAILQAMDAELAARDSHLATKTDLAAAVHALELKMEGLRIEMREVGTKWVLWSAEFWLSGIGVLFSLLKWLK